MIGRIIAATFQFRFMAMYILYHFLDKCKVTTISGDFKQIDSSLMFEFSANHPDATFQCKADSRGISNCK